MKTLKWCWLLFVPCLLHAQSDSVAEDPDFAVITIRQPGFRILSAAYTYYVPARFENRTFDTACFETRRQSFEYCGVTRKMIDPKKGTVKNVYFRVIPVKNHLNDKICFTFKIRNGYYEHPFNKHNVNSLFTLFPEMRCYRRFHWILDEEASRKEFRRFMRKNRWYDLRICYEEGDDTYQMVLKGNEHSLTLKVYPVFNSGLFPFEELARPDPERLHKSYSKALERERKRFDTKIRRRIRGMQTQQNQYWDHIQKYFSEEELAMTKEEWVLYYQEVILNEKEYLPGSPYHPAIMLRALRLKAYQGARTRFLDVTLRPRCVFEGDSMFHEPTQMIFINKETLQYYMQDVINLTPDGVLLADIPLDMNFVALLSLPDGDIAMMQFRQSDPENNLFWFKGVRFDPEMVTIEAVMEFLGL